MGEMMARAIGKSLAFDQPSGPFDVVPVGVFLESVDGAYLEYQFPVGVTDDADEDEVGFREYVPASEALGDLPIWWKTLGVQNEIGLFPSLAESGQFITPREWPVWNAEHSSWLGVKLFIVSAARMTTSRSGHCTRRWWKSARMPTKGTNLRLQVSDPTGLLGLPRRVYPQMSEDEPIESSAMGAAVGPSTPLKSTLGSTPTLIPLGVQSPSQIYIVLY